MRRIVHFEGDPGNRQPSALRWAFICQGTALVCPSIYIMRRSNRYVAPDDETKLLDD